MAKESYENPLHAITKTRTRGLLFLLQGQNKFFFLNTFQASSLLQSYMKVCVRHGQES